MSGNIIMNNSIIECIWDYSSNEWKVLRTRYDRTTGNHINIANSNWEIIQNPITEDIIRNLSKNASDSNIYNIVNKNNDYIEREYYQQKTDLALPMRSWNNTIKRYLITLSCEPYVFNKVHNDSKKSVVVIPKKVLDFGVGRGGDLSKYNDSCVELLVGIDIDRNGFEGEDGAISRYRKIQRKMFKRFPILECEDKVQFKYTQMEFINADSTFNFTEEEQSKSISNIKEGDIRRLNKYLTGDVMYDVFSAQFTFHYYLKSEKTFKTFMSHFELLKPGGYFIMTCFDGDLVHQKLQENKGRLLYSYINDKGSKDVLFEIVQKYKDEDAAPIKTGVAINVFNKLVSETQSNMEYLVSMPFIVQNMKKYANMELVETELFQNIYDNQKEFYLSTKHKRSKLREYFSNKDEITKNSIEFSNLNRYYVFQKKIQHTTDINKIMNTPVKKQYDHGKFSQINYRKKGKFR